MKSIIGSSLIGALVLLPAAASAHEEQVFEIGGKMYQFTVGSLNEPIVVDDKTGVDLRVALTGSHSEGEDHHEAGTPVNGLEETLKVELSAGEEKKVLELSPVYNAPGAYKAVFFPTVATTYSYRFFGEVEGTPIDLTFTCNPAGHGEAKEDTTEVEVSPGVTRHLKTGAFGCPAEKATMGFPEESESVRSLVADVNEANGLGATGTELAVLALLIAGYGAMRKS